MDISNTYGILNTQQELLLMMKDTHNYLAKNGIVYSLIGGSLLGAVREHGFIPWDDDIDIVMDRQNFDKFIQNGFNLSGYCIERKLWLYKIRKIEDRNLVGAPTIDIFVVDRTPDNVFLRKLKVFMIRICQGMMHENIQYGRYNFFYKICVGGTYLLGCFFSNQFKYNLYNYVSQLWGNENSRFVSIYDDLFYLVTFCYDGNLMNDVILRRFEDSEFFIISRYDNYLTVQYGNYMEPPAEKDRRPSHSYC